ncbi:S8 family serine peptidase [Variovorax sp. YR752]|uniref:S8 family serine peptidase n=1 Tax=Variovorax sp. YR752 TaxID=1884383 RepID=UPI003137C70C
MTVLSIRRWLATIGAATAALVTAPTSAAELLVRFHDAAAPMAAAVTEVRRELAPGMVPIGSSWFRVTTSAPASRAELSRIAARLRRDPRITHVLEPGHEELTRVPDDTLYASDQWWLGESVAGSAGVPDLPAAWDRSVGLPAAGFPPVVAILDSGYTSHPELDSRWVGSGHDFVSSTDYANDGNGRDNDARDPGDRLTDAEIKADLDLWDGCEARERSSWHGTLMAGQIGAVSNNRAGVAGIHWDARILPVRVAGKCGAAVGDVVDGMRWAAGLNVAGAPPNTTPAKVLVVGVAGFSSCDTADSDPNVAAAAQLYIDTIAEIRAAGAIVVAAAGNQRGAVGRPASCPGAFAVTSLNRQGFKAIYANFGSQVALATVGGDAANGRDCDTQLADAGIVSTFNLGTGAAGDFGYAAATGTSFAAPVVGGVAALMWSLNPALSVAQVEAGLRASARPHVQVPLLQACQASSGNKGGRCQCDDTICGAGVLDADQALAYAAAPAGYVAPQRTAVSLDTPQIRACARSLGLPVPDDPPADNEEGSGGGGATGLPWLMLLLAAVGTLSRQSRRLD